MNFILDSIRRFLQWIRELIAIILEWFRNFSGGGGTIPDDKCCVLARRDKECQWVGSKSNFSCAQGFHRQWWYCCEGTQQIACAECTSSPSTCWSGSFDCSIWWYTGQTC
ncbi:MAG: hypothetical protein ACRERX_14430 [Pseudomonas sp.]